MQNEDGAKQTFWHGYLSRTHSDGQACNHRLLLYDPPLCSDFRKEQHLLYNYTIQCCHKNNMERAQTALLLAWPDTKQPPGRQFRCLPGKAAAGEWRHLAVRGTRCPAAGGSPARDCSMRRPSWPLHSPELTSPHMTLRCCHTYLEYRTNIVFL